MSFVELPDEKAIEVYVDDRIFTVFLHSDTLLKHVLYPIYTSSGKTITRGFPINPQDGEKTDHPHQVGLWFTFGDVNGLDFWNNSSSVKKEDKCKFGTVRFLHISEIDIPGNKLVVESEWVDCHGNVLLQETTSYIFTGKEQWRSIIRETTLTAIGEKVVLTENKEGLLGLRVARSLEEDISGIYANQWGDKGNDVWGKRASWVSLSGKVDDETDVSIVLFDHPDNLNYPAWAHARGYGLFAVNSLGGTAFDINAEKVNVILNKGDNLSLKYKMLIKDGNPITVDEIEEEMSF